MNEKEVSEIRRRFKFSKGNISFIRGCYVSGSNEIIYEFRQPLAAMPEDEADAVLAVMRKTLSGVLGTNLINIEFSEEYIQSSDEYILLRNLRSTCLEDDGAVLGLYNSIISSVSVDGGYLILLAAENYDFFKYNGDGLREEDSSEVFSYIICSICPIRLTKPALGFFTCENVFRNIAANSIVSAPEFGFLYPSFDGRETNLSRALYYTRDIKGSYDSFADNIFKVKLPMPAAIQKETFRTVLEETVAEDCNFEVVQAVHEKLSEMIEEHKDEKPLTVSREMFSGLLQSCGVQESRVNAFGDRYDECFGANTEIRPRNIVNPRQFEVHTADVIIKVNPERRDLVDTRIIDGKKYIMILAEDNIEVNGININF